jgi:murein DD-endopeptidase MepM/ murein hydrolase activator NlpD
VRVVLVLVAAVVAVVASTCPAVAQEAGVAYEPPVPGPVVDPWRAPAGPFGAGNRGVDLAAEPGEPVRAAAAGVVAFAGAIAGRHHVVVVHPDGLRTTYAFLQAHLVARGDRVGQGTVVGTAAGAVHFGVRDGDRYLDPMLLLWGPGRVHLVPVHGPTMGSEADERSGLVRFLGGALRAGSAAVAWVADGAGEVVDAAGEAWAGLEAWLVSTAAALELAARYLVQPLELLEAFRRMQAYRADQRGCTPSGTRPPRPSGRRIAVLVAGFGSDGRGDAVAGLDTRALGYADADVAQFSYAGGQVGGERLLAGVPVRPYGPDDSWGDLVVSAERLREMLHQIRVAHPGVPIDVVAHSQGGLVARAALADLGIPDARLGGVANLVTLGAPHTGADLATAAAWVASSSLGAAVVAGTGAVVGADRASTAAGQLVEGSDFLRFLGRTRVRGTVRFTSIAAAGDLTVTANHSAVGEAVNVLLPGAPGLGVHDGLPGSPATTREVALALAGMGPTCRSLWLDTALTLGISTVEDLVAGTLGTAGHLAGRGLPGRLRPPPTRTPGPASLPSVRRR